MLQIGAPQGAALETGAGEVGARQIGEGQVVIGEVAEGELGAPPALGAGAKSGVELEEMRQFVRTEPTPATRAVPCIGHRPGLPKCVRTGDALPVLS